jgi:hypothetical protein
MKTVFKCTPWVIILSLLFIPLSIACFYVGRLTSKTKVVTIKIPSVDTFFQKSEINNIAKQRALESSKTFSKLMDTVAQVVADKEEGIKIVYVQDTTLIDKVDSLLNIIDTTLTQPVTTTQIVLSHDTVYVHELGLTNYYSSSKKLKIGMGQSIFPLYGWRIQGLVSVRADDFTLKNLYPSVGLGIRYDYNKLSFLFGGYYNFTSFYPGLSLRYDIKRF